MQKYISLKEAAQISGYAPDYIGQLIRAGKIRGRQVYLNVAWVTTEQDIIEYLEKVKSQKSGTRSGAERLKDRIYELKNKLVMELQFIKFVRWVLYGTVTLSIALILIIFYIFSVSIDKRFQERALERAPVPVSEDADTFHDHF